MAGILKAVVVVLASSVFVAQSMEPLAGPLVTQTVMQAGGTCSCVRVLRFVCRGVCMGGLRRSQSPCR